MRSFKDLFSTQAEQYARYRPGYPESLIKWVTNLPLKHDLAWDAGTGNGQTAIELASHFKKVIATDASLAQIKNATTDLKIEYHVALAENVSFIADQTVDLVTVATAVHWFNLEEFYQEVYRVLKPHSWIALWTYGHDRTVENTQVDEILKKFEEEVGPYWASEIQYVRDRYQTILFPFKEIQAPTFAINREITLDEMLGYLSSWSATQKLVEMHGMDALSDVESRLKKIWRVDEKYKITWPIYLRVGQKI